MSPTVKVSRLNHWTGREVLRVQYTFLLLLALSCFCWFLSVIHPPRAQVSNQGYFTPVSVSNHEVRLIFSLQDVSYASFVFCSSSICSASSFCSALVHLHPFTTTILQTFSESRWPEEKSILLWHIMHCKMKNQLQSSVFSSTLLQNKLSIPSRPILPWSWNTNSSFLYPSLHPFFCTTPPTWYPSPPLLLPRSLLKKLKSQFFNETLSHSSSVFSCFLFWTPICFISWTHLLSWTIGFPVAQRVNRLPAMLETWIRSLGWEDPLEKEMATYSGTLAWKMLWTE